MIKNELEFTKLLLMKLYISDFKIIDINSSLDEFMIYLKKIINSKCLLEENCINKIFEKDLFYNNYQYFINLIFNITEYPKYSKYNEIEKRIYLNFDDEYLEKELEKISNVDENIIDSIVLSILENHQLWPHKRYVKNIKK